MKMITHTTRVTIFHTFKLNTIGLQLKFTHLLILIVTRERNHPIMVQREITLTEKSQLTDFEEEVEEVLQDLEEDSVVHNI